MTEQMSLFGEPGDAERVEVLDALQVGDVVTHRLEPGLVGRIEVIEDGRAALRLITWPTEFLRRWYSDGRTCPVLAVNLLLSE